MHRVLHLLSKQFAACAVAVLAVAPAVSMAQWETARQISAGDSSTFLNENMGRCLAVSGDTVHVVWWQNTPTGLAIYYKRSLDAGVTWGSDTRISPSPSKADFPSIAVCGATVHVVYRNTPDTTASTMYLRSLDGGATWSTPVSLGEYYWWPSISAEGSLVAVALNDKNPGNTEVYARCSTDNGTSWNSVHRISNAAGRSEDPSIATSAGYVYLAWNDNRTGIMQSWYRRSSDQGETWGDETELSFTTGSTYTPFIHATGAHVDFVNSDRRPSAFEVWGMQSSDFGVTWSADAQISHGGGLYPVLDRDAANVFIIWAFTTTKYIHSGDGGATWDPIVVLADSSSKAGFAFIAVSGSVVHTIWRDSRSGKSTVYYNRNPTGNGKSTPQLPQATLSRPDNGATNLPSTDTLLWSLVAGATHYQLQISTRQDFATTIIDDTTLVEPFRIVSGLAESTQFFWRACGLAAGANSVWSTVSTFTTVGSLPATILLHPADGTTKVPLRDTLKWNVVTGEPQYEVELALDPGFSNLAVHDTAVMGTMRVCSGLKPSTTYHWRVRTHDDAGVVGSWSVSWSFTTTAPVSVLEATAAPSMFDFVAIAPAPFHDEARITVEAVTPSVMSLSVVDVLGRTVAVPFENAHVAGRMTVAWRPNDLPPGMYAFRLAANGETRWQRVMRVQ